MVTLQAKRRNFFIAIAAVVLLTFMLYSSPSLDTDRFKHIIPSHSSDTVDENTDSVAAPGTNPAVGEDKVVIPSQPAPAEPDAEAPKKVNLNEEEELESKPDESLPEASDDKISEDVEPIIPEDTGHSAVPNIEDDTAGPEYAEELEVSEDPSVSDTSDVGSSAATTEPVKTSKFHYIVPGSKANLQLCINLLSSAANRYPAAFMAGFNGTGDFDAAKTHLAKLRAINRYLDALPAEEDDDLVLIVDGYDIIQQLPVEIVIDRYFDIVQQDDERVAKRFGLKVEEAKKQGLHSTLFFGPDKLCWPIDYDQARCWAVPPSTLPRKAFGPLEGNGEMRYADPHWLNSGTLIGPVGHMRELLHGTLEEIEITYSRDYEFRESDQYYLANIWGRQEYYRTKQALGGGQRVPGGGKHRVIPERRSPDQVTEYHIGIEYESSLFQTKAGYEEFFGFLPFKHAGLAASVERDMFKEKERFKPFKIHMPGNVVSALSKIYDSIPEAHPGSTSAEWISKVKLGTNFITKHIFAVWHCTGPKQYIKSEFRSFWFYPYAKSLLKSATKEVRGDALITDRVIDGRLWKYKLVYPEDSEELGGAYSDWETPEGTFIGWEQLCGKHHDFLFKGETEQRAKQEKKVGVEGKQ